MAALCPFCEIVAGRAPATIVQEWPDAVALAPLDPVVEGHTLVIPREHVSNAHADPEVTAGTMRRAAELARDRWPHSNILTSTGRSATQSVMHLHIHAVPRREGDWLMLPWGTTGDPHAPHWCEVAHRLQGQLDELTVTGPPPAKAVTDREPEPEHPPGDPHEQPPARPGLPPLRPFTEEEARQLGEALTAVGQAVAAFVEALRPAMEEVVTTLSWLLATLRNASVIDQDGNLIQKDPSLCGCGDCQAPATTALRFRDQPGHVHNCGPHAALNREWSDVTSSAPTPCPCLHDGTAWTAYPRDLEQQ